MNDDSTAVKVDDVSNVELVSLKPVLYIDEEGTFSPFSPPSGTGNIIIY